MDFNTDFISFDEDPNQPTPFDPIPGLFDFNDPVIFSEDPAIIDQSLIELFNIDHLEDPKQASVPTTRPEDCMVQQDLLERVLQLEKQSQQQSQQVAQLEKSVGRLQRWASEMEEWSQRMSIVLNMQPVRKTNSSEHCVANTAKLDGAKLNA